MIRHTVLFRLSHAAGSAEEASFLEDARALADIPGVQNLEQLRVLTGDDFDYSFSMEFADQDAYTFYNEHPVHVAFVSGRWVPEVASFLEVDYAPLG